MAGQPADEPADQSLGGPMFYTSGTTGRPKGVRSSIAQTGGPLELLEIGAKLFGDQIGTPPDGVTLLCGPAYHSAQWAWAVMPLLAGSTLVMREHFDPADTLATIDAHGVTNVHLVPTQMTRLLRLPDDARDSFSGESLQIVHHGAAPCPPDVKRRMIEWWGPKLVEYYGAHRGRDLLDDRLARVARAPRAASGSRGRPSRCASCATTARRATPARRARSGCATCSASTSSTTAIPTRRQPRTSSRACSRSVTSATSTPTATSTSPTARST